MKQLQNGIYTPTIGEKDWGEEVNQNFEVLDDLIKKALETDDKCQTMAYQIQTNANEINKVNNDLNGSLTSSTANLQNQIDILNNNTTALNYKFDNLTKIDNAAHSEEADIAILAYKANVAKKVENLLTIGNISYDGSTSETVPIDGQPTANSANLVTSAGVYSALETKQNKATTIKGYNITDAYTKSEIDNMLSDDDANLKVYIDTKVSGLVNSAPETLDTLNELAQALGNDPNFATTIANQIGSKANTSDLSTVATSGSYNDLNDKPTIPTVNNATLTIQKNSTTVKTFTANASENVTANITVPTKTSELTNDSGFLTTHSTVDSALSSTSTNAVQNKVVNTALNNKANTTDLTTHTNNTTIHVTANDKSKWDSKQDALSAKQIQNITDVTSKANDSDAVHKSGNETINGVKTFNDDVEFNISKEEISSIVV